jgi:hypothetical protein
MAVRCIAVVAAALVVAGGATATSTRAGMTPTVDHAELTRLRERMYQLEVYASALETKLAAAEDGSKDGHAASSSAGRRLAEGRWTIVFNMGTDVSIILVSIVMLTIIMVTVAVEKLVHRARHIPSSYRPIVNKLEEEFMILGAVSFLIVIVEVSAGVTHAQLLNIEFAHLLLFFAAINLVGFALKQLVAMAGCQGHWDRLERCDKALMTKALELQDHERQHTIHRFGRAILSFFRPYAEFDAKESAEHLVLRKVFCDAHQLVDWDDRGTQFDFSLYLRRSLSEVVLMRTPPLCSTLLTAIIALACSAYECSPSSCMASSFC